MQNPHGFVSSREVYRNPWMRVREDQVIRPGGERGLFGVVEMKPGATVLALSRDDEVYLVREYKYAVGRASTELISGAIEPRETPLEAARRELREEAGLLASEWIDMGQVDPFTTAVSSPNHLFLARGLSEGERQPDPGEVLHLERKPLDEAVGMALAGGITHAASVILLLKVEHLLRRRG
jgi:ADP-ribose pyrophosphatase